MAGIGLTGDTVQVVRDLKRLSLEEAGQGGVLNSFACPCRVLKMRPNLYLRDLRLMMFAEVSRQTRWHTSSTATSKAR
eukprot:430352-Rhodomonas_salina.1